MELGYFFLIFAVGFFTLPGGECFNVTDEFIEAAENFTRIEKAPFVAAIFGKDEIFGSLIFCMVTILSESWLLTSARCYPEDSSGEYLIMTGAPFVYMEKEEHQIDFVLRHGIQREETDDYDIALIKTKKPIKFNDKQKPISIGNSEDMPKVGDVLRVTSFPVNAHTSAEFLRSANLSVISLDKFMPFDNQEQNWNQRFCASLLHECDGDESLCNFRAGTVAIVNDRVVGITDFGISTYGPEAFIYIDPFRDWILKHIQN